MDEQGDARSVVDSVYVAHYLDVLRQLRSHLSGQAGAPLPPSFIPPTGCWTSREKDSFFHGLSVHSRLRPDLIAECISTKSIVDVCNYLEVLEEAASSPEHNEVSIHRRAFPAAMEMSQEWIEFEEDKAAGILTAEGCWDEEAQQRKRSDDILAHKMFLKAERKREREGDEVEVEASKSQKLALTSWLEKQTRRWKQEDFCKSLDNRDLVAVGMILRDAEQIELDIAEQATGETSQRQQIVTQPQTATSFDESVIDPVLLALSRNSQQPASPIQTDNRGEPRPAREASLSPGPSTTLAHLSPTSRRRYQKRLYMRRKRAKLSGREVDDKVRRLKPGRKAKKVMRSTSSTADAAVGASAEALDVESEQHEDGDFRRSHASGKTLPYKILAEFTALGIDAEVLGELGLDLFHPGGLAKLMK
jgi:hypothetical protein